MGEIRADRARFQVDADRLQVHDAELHIELSVGDVIKDFRVVLNLRRGRAETLTRRIYSVFCALAAARVGRSDGWLSVDEIGQLDGWAREGSVAKLLANEFEFGAQGIIEQRGRGGALRLRMPAAQIKLGELPETVRRLFSHEPPPVVRAEDLLPQPIVERDLAVAVADALRYASSDQILQVRPAYQGGHSSLVFRGLALRSSDAAHGHPATTAVLIKVPLGITAGKLVVHADSLEHERKLLASHAGWPGLPSRVEPLRVDLRVLDRFLRQHGVTAHDDMLAIDALVLPLGHPRTIEAEPRLLSGILDETSSPMRRLSRRDIRNILTVAERLARLLRMLHHERRAHRHLSVDSIVVRYELGIFENVLAPDLAASVQTRRGSDDLLYRDLFDLGRVLAHAVTGTALSRERQNFQPPEFPGRRLLKRAVVGAGETVARLLSCVTRYLLEASPGTNADREGDPTVKLLDHFLDEIDHIDMMHRARARGVPERRVSLLGVTAPALAHHPLRPREIWERSAADPVATRLVTISHFVDMSTLRRWCERYVTDHRWHLGLIAHRNTASSATPSRPTVETCLQMLRDGFGRSAAEEMWRYLWNAGSDEPAEKLVRILRNYATHWIREERFDISHWFGERGCHDGRAASCGLGDELEALAQANVGRPDRQLLVDWIAALKLLSPRNRSPIEQRREAFIAAERTAAERAATAASPDAREYERLRSWLQAGALMWQLQSKTAPPLEKDILSLERTLQVRSSQESAFWHLLLARAWASAAARWTWTETRDDEPAWDKAMRALLVAAGIASSRRLPFEMAATLLASAALTRLGLSTPELRAEFSSQGVDEESVRVQAAECALLAADAYQWLDAEPHHWGALLEAAWLLQGSAFPERLLQAFQLVSLARNNRVLYRAVHHRSRDNAPDSPAQFEGYPPGPDDHDRRAAREAVLFHETYRAWATAPGRLQTSDDPGTVAAHGYFSRYVPGVRQLFPASNRSSRLQIELEVDADMPAKAVDRLLDLVGRHYGLPCTDRILDFGCGDGDDARHLARDHHVWAVDSPQWFTASRGDAAPINGPAPRFIAMDPVEYARRICDGEPPDGSPVELDVVLFRCALCRISQRAVVLQAAHKLLRPGGLVVATDWIQTRVTDRITWSRVVGTGRFADLETEPGYQRLCSDHHFTDFVSWQPCAPADKTAGVEFVRWEAGSMRDATQPAMHRWFQRRLEDVRKLEDERGRPSRSPYERAFLLRLKRDLDAFAALSGPDGPLGWVFWAARKPLDGPAAG